MWKLLQQVNINNDITVIVVQLQVTLTVSGGHLKLFSLTATPGGHLKN